MIGKPRHILPANFNTRTAEDFGLMSSESFLSGRLIAQALKVSRPADDSDRENENLAASFHPLSGCQMMLPRMVLCQCVSRVLKQLLYAQQLLSRLPSA